jgi:hypothetical protein
MIAPVTRMLSRVSGSSSFQPKAMN